MTDKLLQGEKFSSAAYAGAKTGGLAYAAGQIGKTLQGGDQAPATPDTRPETGYGSKAWQDASNRITQDRINAEMANGKLIQDIAGKMGMSGAKHTADMVGGVPVSIDGVPVPTNLFSSEQLANINAARALGNAMKESAIMSLFALIETRLLDEGILDGIKKAAGNAVGKAANYLNNQAHNVLTRVTADKMTQAWKQAGSPTDSEAVKKILTGMGVDTAVVDNAMSGMALAPTAPSLQAPAPQTNQNSTTSNIGGNLQQTANVTNPNQMPASALRTSDPLAQNAKKTDADADEYRKKLSQYQGYVE
jgi:hypothetical protein